MTTIFVKYSQFRSNSFANAVVELQKCKTFLGLSISRSVHGEDPQTYPLFFGNLVYDSGNQSEKALL